MQSPPRYLPEQQVPTLGPIQSESPRNLIAVTNLRTEPDMDNSNRTADKTAPAEELEESKKADFTFKMPTKLLSSTIGKSDT